MIVTLTETPALAVIVDIHDGAADGMGVAVGLGDGTRPRCRHRLDVVDQEVVGAGQGGEVAAVCWSRCWANVDPPSIASPANPTG